MTSVMQNPKFSTVLGLILEAKALEALKVEEEQLQNQLQQKQQALNPNEVIKNINPEKKLVSENGEHDVIGKLANSLKSVFKDLF